MGRFGGMLLRGSGQASWEAKDGLRPRGRVASARLVELIQLTLVADAAIVDLRPYAERQRAIGAAEHLETAGILLSGGEAETSEALLWRFSDPIEASANHGEVSQPPVALAGAVAAWAAGPPSARWDGERPGPRWSSGSTETSSA